MKFGTFKVYTEEEGRKLKKSAKCESESRRKGTVPLSTYFNRLLSIYTFKY